MSTAPLWSVTIGTSLSAAERIADTLGALPEPEPVSVAFNDDGSPDHWTVTAHYSAHPNLSLLATRLEEQGLPNNLHCEQLPDVDWVAKSLEHLPPITTDRFFVAGAHDAHQAPAHKASLTIEAGQAFGTGHHETTLACLMRIEHKLKSNRFGRILDLGTGTGVLALAIAKLGRTRVIASDIDPIAIEVAKINAKKNGLHSFLRLVTATGFQNTVLEHGGPYDLIVANILARPLMRLAPDMRKNTNIGSTIILSGLLANQERMVLSAYFLSGFRLVHRLQIGDWTTLELCR